MKKPLLILLGIALAVAGYFLIQYQTVGSRIEAAREQMALGDYRETRYLLRNVLWYQPKHAEANLLMAEALITDESLSLPGDVLRDREIVQQALDHLDQIPDASPLAALAHQKAAELLFNYYSRPTAAMRRLDRAMKLDPNLPSIYELRMRMYAMLGRPRYGINDMWKMYELISDEDRPKLLRRWFMYEFFPDTSLTEIDRQMGFAAPNEATNSVVASRRLQSFKNSEPQAALGYAATANWLLKQTDPELAQQLLNISLNESNDIDRCEFWFVVAVDVLENLGTLDDAVALVERWPEPREGYDYWRARAMVELRVQGEPERALESYSKAIKFWPGPIDWSMHNMMAACLRELGRTEEAIEKTERAAEVEKLLRDDTLQPILSALLNLEDAEGLKRLVNFYDELDMPRERAAWQAVIDQLESKSQGSADESSGPADGQSGE